MATIEGSTVGGPVVLFGENRVLKLAVVNIVGV